MINVSEITDSIVKILKDDAFFIKEKAFIERSEYINLDYDKTPWICVYKSLVRYDPRTIGKHAGSWDAEIELNFLVQASDLESGEACSDKLDLYIKTLLDALWNDPTFTNTIEMITGMEVKYLYERDQSETVHFQMADVLITGKTRSG